MKGYIDMDGKRCSVAHTTHTLHSNKENKTPINIRMRRTRHERNMKYCALAEMDAGTFYEKASSLYIQINPVDGMVLVVEKPSDTHRIRGFDDELQEMIVRDDLDTLLSKLKQVNGPLHISKKKQFLSVIKQYQKLNTPSDELRELMHEAKGYFEQ